MSDSRHLGTFGNGALIDVHEIHPDGDWYGVCDPEYYEDFFVRARDLEDVEDWCEDFLGVDRDFLDDLDIFPADSDDTAALDAKFPREGQ